MFYPLENTSIAGKRSKSYGDSDEGPRNRKRKSSGDHAAKKEDPKACKKSLSKKTPSTHYATADDIILKKGKGSPGRGGGPRGFYWNIAAWGQSAGKVFINWIDEPPIGPHASLQIFLNKKSRGKHIGRIVYAQACTLSSFDEVYAHIAKSNLASIKSALAAGFTKVTHSQIRQSLLKWTRPK